MNEDLRNVRNFKTETTPAKAPPVGPNDIDEGTPIVSAPYTSPQVTGPSYLDDQNQDIDDEVNYLKQQSVAVRKYRLKK